MPLDHASLDALRRTHPAWRLLAADQAPFVASLLHTSFVAPNVRSLPEHARGALGFLAARVAPDVASRDFTRR